VKMPGKTGIEVARSLTDDLVCAVVILSAFSQRGLVDEAINAGVLAYLIKPFQRNEIAVQIEVARARHQQMKDLASEVDSLNQRLSDRVLLDRAKGVLIDQYGLGEAEAMRFVQKRAMDQRRPVRDVAAEVLDGSLTP
jgi:AmiR/NasT family two-component response regulator